jgi:hypothetical protein
MFVQKSLKRESRRQAIEAAKQDMDPTVRRAAQELEFKLADNNRSGAGDAKE